MRTITKFFKANKSQTPILSSVDSYKQEAETESEKENLVFVIAVMGYTLKTHPYEQYEEKEKAFLHQINGNNPTIPNVSKTYRDLANEVDVSVYLLSDMDPRKVFECSRPNGISSKSHACIIMYDPTQEGCLDNLVGYFRDLIYTRNGRDSDEAIMCFVGINGDIPEKHRFTKCKLLSVMGKYYDENKISIYSVSLNPSLNCPENVEIIIKNLAIACLNVYMERAEEIWAVTSALGKPKPLALPKSWETPYSFYRALTSANNSKAVFGDFLPTELIKYMTMICIDSIFQEYENPTLQLSIYKEMFMEETTCLSEKLLISSSSKQMMDKADGTVEKGAIDTSDTGDEKHKESKENCLVM